MNIEVVENNGRFSWDELIDLMHEAFQERLEQGLRFTCSFMTAEDLRRQLQNSTILVAVDSDKEDALVGMGAIDVKEDENGKWAYMSDLAVYPQYKRSGVMSRIFQEIESIAKSNGCEFIESDTAVGAKSSVKWHKKNGFKIVDLYSFKSTNYYSYILKKDLTPHHDSQGIGFLKERIQLNKKMIQYRMYNKADGKKRESKWLDLYLKLRGVK